MTNSRAINQSCMGGSDFRALTLFTDDANNNNYDNYAARGETYSFRYFKQVN